MEKGTSVGCHPSPLPTEGLLGAGGWSRDRGVQLGGAAQVHRDNPESWPAAWASHTPGFKSQLCRVLSCVTSGKKLPLSVPKFPHLENRIVTAPSTQGVVRIEDDNQCQSTEDRGGKEWPPDLRPAHYWLW